MALGHSTEYDVVVVGAGLGGLSAAAACSRSGLRVLLVEAQDGPGGYAHAFDRGLYRFDPAVHVTSLAHEGEFLSEYLRALGALDAVRFLDLDEFYGIDLPGLRMSVPHGQAAFIDAHAERWPRESAGIRDLVELCRAVFDESQQLSTRTSWRDLDAAVRQFPLMFGHRMSTLSDVMHPLIGDAQARAALSSLWPYMGVPPSRLTFTGFCSMLMSMLDRGPSYCRGGFQSLADALAGVIAANGGTLLYSTRVEQILLASGRAAGVRLVDGTTVRSEAVVSNIDARSTFHGLVGAQALPAAYVRRLDRMVPSWSAFVLFAATTLDLRSLAPAHETFIFDDWDHDRSEQAVRAGLPGGMWMSVPTLVDPSMAPPGEHAVVFSTLADPSARAWQDGKDEVQAMMLARLDRLLPGIASSLTYLDSATPHTLARFSGSASGAIYGWENTPQQSQPKRLRGVTPIAGLYLAGHWSEPGAGSFRVILSGMQTAAAVLGVSDPITLLARLHAAGAGRSATPA
jgi:prolycopene isomerase